MTWTLEGKPLRSILVSRLRYLGDVVMSTVVLEALKEGDPGLEIGYLCEREAAPVLADHPYLDRVHVLETRRSGADAQARKGLSETADQGVSSLAPRNALGMINQLGKFRYDLAVDLFFNPRSAWLLRFSGIPRRIGGTSGSRRHLYNYSILREDVAASHPGFDLVAPGGLGAHLCRLDPLVHQQSGLGFSEWLIRNHEPGDLSPRLASRTPGPRGKKALIEAGIGADQPYLLLVPGATWPSKEWPISLWQDLIAGLIQGTEDGILVLSPPGAVRTWASLADNIPAGRGGVLPVLDLEDALALLGQAAGVVSVDGGIMHAAVGLRRPTVALFGPTSPEIWFPYEAAGPFKVVATAPSCHPCNLHDCPDFICLPELKPDTVLAALAEVRGRNPEPGSGIEGFPGLKAN